MFPLFAITAAQRLGMESTKTWHLIIGIRSLLYFATIQRASLDVGLQVWTAFLTSVHKFSIGLTSGDCGGHSIMSMMLSANHFLAQSLSCRQTQISSISSSAYGSITFCRISSSIVKKSGLLVACLLLFFSPVLYMRGTSPF